MPLINIGKLKHNENSDDHFAHVQQAAFALAHLVESKGYSSDKMLQRRILLKKYDREYSGGDD
ncbi:catalase [Pedobacter sp. SYSU D00535]|uniref:catalase n=1 Tax=Pedobacter sp. SYSU D00535 TaxID=2810308 RepID=UPI001A96B6A1